jgi:hypothetical protein
MIEINDLRQMVGTIKARFNSLSPSILIQGIALGSLGGICLPWGSVAMSLYAVLSACFVAMLLMGLHEPSRAELSKVVAVKEQDGTLTRLQHKIDDRIIKRVQKWNLQKPCSQEPPVGERESRSLIVGSWSKPGGPFQETSQNQTDGIGSRQPNNVSKFEQTQHQLLSSTKQSDDKSGQCPNTGENKKSQHQSASSSELSSSDLLTLQKYVENLPQSESENSNDKLFSILTEQLHEKDRQLQEQASELKKAKELNQRWKSSLESGADDEQIKGENVSLLGDLQCLQGTLDEEQKGHAKQLKEAQNEIYRLTHREEEETEKLADEMKEEYELKLTTEIAEMHGELAERKSVHDEQLSGLMKVSADCLSKEYEHRIRELRSAHSAELERKEKKMQSSLQKSHEKHRVTLDVARQTLESKMNARLEEHETESKKELNLAAQKHNKEVEGLQKALADHVDKMKAQFLSRIEAEKDKHQAEMKSSEDGHGHEIECLRQTLAFHVDQMKENFLLKIAAEKANNQAAMKGAERNSNKEDEHNADLRQQINQLSLELAKKAELITRLGADGEGERETQREAECLELQEANKRLQQEVKEVQAAGQILDVKLVCLKNMAMQYISKPPGAREQAKLLPVLGSLLQVSYFRGPCALLMRAPIR